MSKVRVLSPEVISKIAAGEVIERPASVLKELVENALDAGTSSVAISLKEAGKTLLSIKDTGSGIEEDDIETIFQRHSTSKIEDVDDLFNIHSLGFRGEALYSIAAVADITLRSRTKDQDTGWEIHMRGGKKIGLKPVTMPVGTEITVQELFFNTPARRKFLKSNTAELGQIMNVVMPYTLLYPGCRFTLEHGGKTLIDLSPTADLRARTADALNLDARHLMEVRKDLAEEKLGAHLVLGDINIMRSRRDLQFLFVNGRPVQSKNISYHMNDVFRLIMPQGQYPFFSVDLTVPPEDVDVNIHPTKREVKVRDEQMICGILRRMCENALMAEGRAKQVLGPSSPDSATAADTAPNFVTPVRRGEPAWDDHLPSALFGAGEHLREPLPTEQYSYPQNAYPQPGEALFGQKGNDLKERLKEARYIGSFINKFLIFESGASLLVVDQHAAQERIMFELLIQQLDKGKVEVQHLLTPYLIKLTPQDLLVWEEGKARLEEIGFSCTQFDAHTVAVHTYPALIKQPDRAVQDILAGGDVTRCDHETIARRACRASVMAGDSLNAEKAVFQREQLMRCRDPFTCPHGRPTVIEIKESFLDKQFLRT